MMRGHPYRTPAPPPACRVPLVPTWPAALATLCAVAGYTAVAVFAFALLLTSCADAPTVTTVAVASCPEPHARWAREAVEGLALPGAAWRVVDSASGADVAVVCVAFPDTEPALARYALGSDRIEVDPARNPSLFGLLGSVRHELLHHAIARGPHPERARLHLCAYEAEADSCWTGGTWPTALMAPTQRTGAQPGLDGAGELAVSEPTIMDITFFSEAMSP